MRTTASPLSSAFAPGPQPWGIAVLTVSGMALLAASAPGASWAGHLGAGTALSLAAIALYRGRSRGRVPNSLALWGGAAGLGALAEILGLVLPPPTWPGVALADVLTLTALLLAQAGVIQHAWGPDERFGRLRTVLDVVVLAGVGTTLGWRLFLAPLWVGLSAAPGLTLWLVACSALALSLVIMLFVAAVIHAGRSRTLAWAGPGLLLWGLAELAFTFMDQRAPGDLGLAMWGRWGAGVLLCLEAFPPRTPAWWRGTLAQHWKRNAALLVRRYAPLVAVMALLWFVIVDWRATGAPDLGGVAIACALALTFVARQGVAAGEHELRGYAQLVENAGDPAFICDGHGRILLANPSLLRALGLTDAQHVVGSSVFDWIPRSGRPLTLARPVGGFTPLVLEAGWSGEVALERRSPEGDSSTAAFSLVLRPIDADAILLAGTAHDLAPQKRQQAELQSAITRAAAAQAELAALNRDLERRVDEKTHVLSAALQQLADQNAQLHKLDELKSDFVSLVSHELRAPLTNLNGGLELVLARGQLAPDTREHLALVQSEVRRLTGFVETILDLSALEAGRLRLNLAPLDLGEVVAGLRAAFVGQPAADRLAVSLPGDLPLVLADDRALASVLFHLVDNAQKYAPDGPIAIDAARGSTTVRVRVSDSGPGIPPEQRATAFERFRRLHNSDDRAVYGHGLGLYMVRQLLRAMGSDIELAAGERGASSEQGAAFEFELPIVEVSDD